MSFTTTRRDWTIWICLGVVCAASFMSAGAQQSRRAQRKNRRKKRQNLSSVAVQSTRTRAARCGARKSRWINGRPTSGLRRRRLIRNGEFVFSDVSAGQYFVTVTALDIVSPTNAAVGVMASVTPAGLKEIFNTPAGVGVDKTFVLRSVPAGSVRLDIVEPRGTNYYIRSITGKGVELLNEPMTIAEGEQVAGVQVILATDLATVEGRIVRAAGGSVAGGGVVLLPVD